MAPNTIHDSIPRDVLPAPLRKRDASLLQPRQNAAGNQVLIPNTYLGVSGDPAPGTVIGIVLGTVLGVLLVIMLVWWAMFQQTRGYITEPIETIEVRRHPHRRSSRRRSRSYSPDRRRRSEIVEERIVEERIPIGIPMRGEAIIVEPRRRRSRGDEEEVIVYEESESSVPMPRRVSSRRSQSRRRSGEGYYRPVDPDKYAGGEYERRPVSRSRRYS